MCLYSLYNLTNPNNLFGTSQTGLNSFLFRDFEHYAVGPVQKRQRAPRILVSTRDQQLHQNDYASIILQPCN